MEGIRMTPEHYEQLRNVKSAEELMKLAKEQGISITEEEAAVIFSKYCAIGEMSDDELENVSGGGCYDAICPRCGGKLIQTGVNERYNHRFYEYICVKCGSHQESGYLLT